MDPMASIPLRNEILRGMSSKPWLGPLASCGEEAGDLRVDPESSGDACVIGALVILVEVASSWGCFALVVRAVESIF